MFLDEDAKQAVREAIRRAEHRTSGELVAVIAREGDDYLYIPLLWAALAALLLPLLGFVAPAGWEWLWAVLGSDLGWGNWRIEPLRLYGLQIAAFVILAVLFRWRPLKMRLVPRAIKRRRAGRLAREQFYAQGLHLTRERTGVLVFVSVAEHYVEILADAGINAKVGDEAWAGIVSDFVERVKRRRVADGFLVAVEACGALLAEHFPRPADDTNELPDHLIEIQGYSN